MSFALALSNLVKWFIKNHYSWIIHNCLCNPQALLHTQRIVFYFFSAIWIKTHFVHCTSNLILVWGMQ